MLGGIGERTALKLMQDNLIEHFYVRQEYLIPRIFIIYKHEPKNKKTKRKMQN